jgi:hypothetical protein
MGLDLNKRDLPSSILTKTIWKLHGCFPFGYDLHVDSVLFTGNYGEIIGVSMKNRLMMFPHV